MDSFEVAEEKLDIVDTWTSSVLTDMLYKEPKVDVIRKIAAFLHPNGVSSRDAVELDKASKAASRRHICTGGVCSGPSAFQVHCSTMI